MKEKIWVVGGKCRETKECFFQLVNQRNGTIFKYLIINFVAEGSIIYTDMWRGCLGVSALGFTHGMANHTLNFVDPVDRNIHISH